MEKEGQFLHIPEFGARFGLSRIDIFRKVKDGSIPHKREGKVYLIPLSFVSQLNGELTHENRNNLDRFMAEGDRHEHGIRVKSDFTYKLSITEIEYIAQKINIEICYNKAVLTNCLETPFLRGERREIFSSVYEKAAVLVYLLVKNRPFLETNHSLIRLSMIWFLQKNGASTNFEEKAFNELCEWVQKGDSRFYKQIIESIIIFLGS